MKQLKQFIDTEWGTFYFVKDQPGSQSSAVESPASKTEAGKDKPLTTEELQKKIQEAVKNEEKRQVFLKELKQAGGNQEKMQTLNEKIQTLLDKSKDKGKEGKKLTDMEKTSQDAFGKEITPEQQEKISSKIGKAETAIVDGLKGKIVGVSDDGVDKDIMDFIQKEVSGMIIELAGKDPQKKAAIMQDFIDGKLDNTEIKKKIESIIQKTKDKFEKDKAKEKKEAYEKRDLTNESFASAVVNEGNEEDQTQPTLALVNQSIKTREEAIKLYKDALKGGEKYTGDKIHFNNNENLRTIGAGDLYPPDVREISIKVGDDWKKATRQGISGGFFFNEGGGYAKILEGDMVKITGMAEDETEKGKEWKKKLQDIRKANAQSVKEFQFSYKGVDKDVEIRPGQKFKQSELVAQMAQRYGVDPHTLMIMSKNIDPSKGTTYLKDLNMTARRLQRGIMTQGNPKDLYLKRGGRKFMNPKYLRSFIGGNKEAIGDYITSSGAKYTAKEEKALREEFAGLDDISGNAPLEGTHVRKILGSKFNFKAGAVAQGFKADSVKGLMAFDTWLRGKTQLGGKKGTLTDLTGKGHAAGKHSHAAGYKADLRAWDDYGKAIAQATGLYRGGKKRTTINFGGYTIKVLRHVGTADHFDLKILKTGK